MAPDPPVDFSDDVRLMASAAGLDPEPSGKEGFALRITCKNRGRLDHILPCEITSLIPGLQESSIKTEVDEALHTISYLVPCSSSKAQTQNLQLLHDCKVGTTALQAKHANPQMPDSYGWDRTSLVPPGFGGRTVFMNIKLSVESQPTLPDMYSFFGSFNLAEGVTNAVRFLRNDRVANKGQQTALVYFANSDEASLAARTMGDKKIADVFPVRALRVICPAPVSNSMAASPVSGASLLLVVTLILGWRLCFLAAVFPELNAVLIFGAQARRFRLGRAS
eukprot:gene28743-31922_t